MIESLADTFERELARLNPAQRAAVDHIDGPVMVLAGPGTGKTHLLSARIGNILQQTDTPAASILCLTYTEAGVKAMRERLLQWIGPEAHRVAIHTFHGFCSQVIRDHLEYFGRRDLEPLSDLERVRVLREMLEGLDPHHPLRSGRSNPYFYERQLSRLFAAMKAENWTSAGLVSAVNEYVARLADYPEFVYQRNYREHRKGDVKAAKVEEEQIRMSRLRAAAELFPAFEQNLAELGRYDYDDMIRWVLGAFREHAHLLRLYQERYLYLLVDEFQDTNGSQEEIVRLLASYWESPNLFIVGDDDQSIYEFQGARLRSMVDFYQRYKEVEVITLRENYRSPQAVLDAAAELIDHNEQRIGKLLDKLPIDKHLRAATADEPVEPEVREYPSPQQELIALVDQLQSWRAAGREYGEMAVIYARHRQGETLKQLLTRAGIPYQSKRRPNVLDCLSVRQLRELLTYVEQEVRLAGSGEHLLYRILHFACFDLSADDLARLALTRRRSDLMETVPTWRELLGRPDLWPADLRQAERIRKTAVWLDQLQAAVHNQPLVVLVEMALNGSGMLAHHLRAPDRMERLQELRTFLSFVEKEALRQPRIDLRKFLSILAGMDANRIEMPLQILTETSQAVQLLTAHSAKGLEFDCVWLLDCVERQWGEGRSSNNQRFKLPPTLTYSGEEDPLEARRRLFYVAMTRAKRRLVMSYAPVDEAGKPNRPVRFLTPILTALNAQVQLKSVGADQRENFLQLQLQTSPVSISPPLAEALIVERLRELRLSVSALHTWLNCPLAFFYERVLAVPTAQRPAATYGEALHEALQNYFLRVRAESGVAWPGQAELVFLFEQALARRRAWLEPNDYDDFLQRGRRELMAYYEQERQNWTSDVRVEQYITNVEIEGAPVQGVIDRVDRLDERRVAIVDYKTGFANPRHTKRPTTGRPAGGTYWRQLVFYKLLYEARARELSKVFSATLSYLTIGSDGRQAQLSLKITPKDEEAMRKIISEAYRQIMNQEFYQGCGEESCRWCQFARDRNAEIPQRDEEIAGLDDLS